MTAFLAGEFVTADGLNLRPFFHGYQLASAVQSILYATQTPITLTAELADTIGGHSNTVNTSRYTPSVPGLYYCTAGLCFATNAVGKFTAQMRKNGADEYGLRYNATMADSTSSGNTLTVSGTARLNGATDYVELCAYHLFAATTATLASVGYGCFMICEWVAP